ncbi:hypothetical protein UFOVP1290_521 [uncultured Caudovirales phage]|uniref:Uncharacterized protein n=1 Tax=uncultured Caudovirales phage TaxID=2100421 RepID=A0A6J5RTW3_9CAUD|nr:hypothetical protein UFOVP1290_521 [uncultured Caudovirales phage]
MIIPTNTSELTQHLMQYKSTDNISLECPKCKKEFFRTKHYIKSKFGAYNNRKTLYCSRQCLNYDKITRKTVECLWCHTNFEKNLCYINHSPNNFCSRNCAAKYNNTHKVKGNRRSKLEKWLEAQLTNLYPELKILFNDKTTINSELDIYIPSLKLAFELNGIFHYEPIYGKDKLSSIQNNDDRKFQACLENDIELVIIDTSGQKYFKENTSQKYLDIIKKIMSIKIIT